MLRFILNKNHYECNGIRVCKEVLKYFDFDDIPEIIWIVPGKDNIVEVETTSKLNKEYNTLYQYRSFHYDYQVVSRTYYYYATETKYTLNKEPITMSEALFKLLKKNNLLSFNVEYV